MSSYRSKRQRFELSPKQSLRNPLHIVDLKPGYLSHFSPNPESVKCDSGIVHSATPPETIVNIAKTVIQSEIRAMCSLLETLDDKIEQVVQTIQQTVGRVIVVGIGKSGHIGRKMAATLSSTGTPAFFVHAAEASHGDLGMITSTDIVMAISYSGETEEMLGLIPAIRRLGVTLVAITGDPNSLLAQHADIALDIGVRCEADSFGIVPTSSTTATLALGDAIAIAASVIRNFSREEFGRCHPGGNLGRLLQQDIS